MTKDILQKYGIDCTVGDSPKPNDVIINNHNNMVDCPASDSLKDKLKQFAQKHQPRNYNKESAFKDIEKKHYNKVTLDFLENSGRFVYVDKKNNVKQIYGVSNRLGKNKSIETNFDLDKTNKLMLRFIGRQEVSLLNKAYLERMKDKIVYPTIESHSRKKKMSLQ